MNFADDIFDAMSPVPASYSRGPDTADLRVVIVESDQAFRTSRRDSLIGSDVSGVVLENSLLRKGGKLQLATGQIYRIDSVLKSTVPGLSDLKLARIEGDAIALFDASDLAPLDDTVDLDGVTIPANISWSVEVDTIDSSGSRLTVSKIFVAVRAADAASAKPGSVVRLDGRRRSVERVMNDGLGLVKLMV
ncbi:hypothetical protein BMI91_19625 [Thioclava sediminum]|uniref:Uncharacterized protein n=1 Tax=Thioclava sediminum TaxID=1915319 RepID=A0ABX3MT36_9RHOB|nr:hypothetical protein [Thioclava sediminum]OOY22494.1 hypothetical protein BMI91_19625 [Thioclava sediminum]